MNLLLTGAWAGAAEHIPELEAMGHAAAFMEREDGPLPVDPAWIEGAVCNGLFLHHDISEMENLRFVQLTSAGLDRVPADRIREAGIELYNARGVYSAPMAEFALAGTLALMKRLPDFTRQQDARAWKKRRGLRELAGSTVLVVGCGSVGAACARLFSAVGCRVVGVARSACAPEPPFADVIGMEALRKGLSAADIAVLCLPLTGETRRLIGKRELAAAKPGAILVNIARGGLVDEAALIAALQDGRLGGAVLDVFEEEPLPAESPLWDMPNVLITPHNSFVGEGNAARLDDAILENLAAFEHTAHKPTGAER